MKLLNKLKRLFTTPKPTYSEGQRIRARKDVRANYSDILPLGVVYYKVNEPVDISKEMVLIFVKESSTKIYFRVRSNFYASDINARDNSIVYFYKSNFKTKNFIKI
jgi:hypothetical protein